jgi:hypothetical protein
MKYVGRKIVYGTPLAAMACSALDFARSEADRESGACKHVGQVAEAYIAACCGNFCYPRGPAVFHTFVVGIARAAAQIDVHCVASSHGPPQ